MELGQIKKTLEHLIKARVVLKRLSAKIVKYRERTVEVKEILSAPIDQRMFSYANT
jgi:hypothetical protein